MRYIHDTDKFTIEGATVVTLGKFDGVHKGHQKLLATVRDKASGYGAMSAAFTFDHIPVSLSRTPGQSFIMTNAERRSFIESLGIDILVEYPFTSEFMNTEPEVFVEDIIRKSLKAVCVVVGPDYTFGKGGRGNVQMLADMADEAGFELVVVPKECYEEREISSTFVREEISKGNIEKANHLLGYHYFVTGEILHGRHLGSTKLGIPTINQIPPEEKLLPESGVYVTEVRLGDQIYRGVSNVGVKPTIEGKNPIGVETHLLDFAGDLYGKVVTVEFLTRVREERKFPSIEALKEEMQSNIAYARAWFEKNEH